MDFDTKRQIIKELHGYWQELYGRAPSANSVRLHYIEQSLFDLAIKLGPEFPEASEHLVSHIPGILEGTVPEKTLMPPIEAALGYNH
jgi:hypothetical protein